MEGKQLTPRTPQEERDHQQRENLLTAISKLTAIGREFEKPEYWEGRQTRKAAQASEGSRYYTNAELFAQQSEGENPEAFARYKIVAIARALREIRKLTPSGYYEGNEVYTRARKYLGYLAAYTTEKLDALIAQGEAEADQHQPSATTEATTTKTGRPAAQTDRQLRDITSLNEAQYNKLTGILQSRYKAGSLSELEPVLLYLLICGKFTSENRKEQHAALTNTLGNIGAYSAYTRMIRDNQKEKPGKFDTTAKEKAEQIAKQIEQ